ncbi:MAG: glycosyltransferase family 39 protein, partial [Candidatus Omnitrophica bacterium]|nr:glycosyltransferase family 39 protein [Candidatus Omnitrophota bacterium]
YIYTDMLLVMFTVLAYNAIYSFYKIPTLKNYLAAGIMIGLAAGAKYNAVLLAVPYLMAHFMAIIHGKKSAGEMLFSGKLWAGAASAAVVFAAVNPYMILDWPNFLESVSKQSRAFWYTGWLHHIAYSLRQGLSGPLVATGGAGLFFIAFKKRWGIILFSFPFVFYLVIVFKSQHFARYVLLLIPFFAVGAAYFVFEVLYKRFALFRSKIVIPFVVFILLAPTAIKSVKADMIFSARDTRTIAAEWIKENLSEGSRIACASTHFRPALKQPYSQVAAKKEFLSKQTGLGNAKAKKLKMTLTAMDQEYKGFPLYFLCEDPDESGQFLDTLPALPYDMNVLRDNAIDYVIISGERAGPEKAEFIEELKIYGSPVKDFSPYSDGVFRKTTDPVATTCIPVANKELFSRKGPGPALRIYRIK